MFTGIIEEMGSMVRVESGSTSGKIQLKAHKVLEGTKIGDSIAVNGVCLTVVELHGNGFTADVSPGKPGESGTCHGNGRKIWRAYRVRAY